MVGCQGVHYVQGACVYVCVCVCVCVCVYVCMCVFDTSLNTGMRGGAKSSNLNHRIGCSPPRSDTTHRSVPIAGILGVQHHSNGNNWVKVVEQLWCGQV